MTNLARLAAIAGFASLLAIIGCNREPGPGEPGERLTRRGDEIVVCGQLFHTGTRVVLWTDPNGYDAYRPDPKFPNELEPQALKDWKYQPSLSPIRNHVADDLKTRVLERSWKLEELQDSVDQFVMHFDVCGTSRRCFKVLHDQRFLSVQFMLDVDGTIYQTMDLKERAFHAKQANDRSIGVEIAHIGAYIERSNPVFKEWYTTDSSGPKLRFPPEVFKNGTGILTPNFVGRPARKEMISGKIHGVTYHQYDFTDEQYRALAKLLATVNVALPKIRLDAPRGADGNVLDRALSDSELGRYTGIIGHYHVTAQKNDPGPAFDWERVLRDARASR
jgi:N-acetylmuramoyl-L-alanine amidase